jgi:chemotaxis methyl-accepting protein methylase
MDEIPGKEYDLVFFRNAFIYFSPRSRGRVLLNLSKVLREGGILLLGVSETAGAHNACFEAGLDEKNRKDVFYFQKKSLFTETELHNKIKFVGSQSETRD